MTNHQAIAADLASRIITAWESESTLGSVFERCHRGPKFDRTLHGRAVSMKLFSEAMGDAGIPTWNLWDRVQVARALIQELRGDYNLATQVIPNLLPVPLAIKVKDLAEAVATSRSAVEALPGVPNPFVEKRPKIKVTAATHSPEVVATYTRAAGLARAASILETDGFDDMSFRVSPLLKTPAFSDSMAYGQLPVVADAFLDVSSQAAALGFASFYLSWEEDTPGFALTQEEDGAWVTSSLPDGRGRFISESGGGILAPVLWSRFVAGRALEAWADGQESTHPLTVIPRLNSVQVIGLGCEVERIVRLLEPLGVVGTKGARAPLPEE